MSRSPKDLLSKAKESECQLLRELEDKIDNKMDTQYRGGDFFFYPTVYIDNNRLDFLINRYIDWKIKVSEFAGGEQELMFSPKEV